MRRFLVLSLLALAAPLAAQTPVTKDAPTSGAAEERAALAVVERLFDAMRAGDSATIRALFVPGAKLSSVSVRQGTPTLRDDSVDEFAKAVGTPRPEVLDERIANARTFVDGHLAVVWTDYWLFIGERFSHCGVDAFQLFKGADGWKIFALADTRRREGCAPAPAKR